MPKIKLTDAQDEAVNQMIDFCLQPPKDPEENVKPFIFSGYAGTGKTTTIGALTTRMDENGISFIQLSPTHRACKILRLATGNPARTVHSLLYMPISTDIYSPKSSVSIVQRLKSEATGNKVYDKHTGEAFLKIHSYTPKGDEKWKKQDKAWYDDAMRKAENYFKRKKLTEEEGYFFNIDGRIEKVEFLRKDTDEIYEEIGDAVLIVDESSMVRADIEDFLAELKNKVIFVGDNAQLPPVYNEDEVEPEFHMTDFPDVELTEIMRSANSTGIPEVGSDIRQENTLQQTYGTNQNVRVLRVPNPKPQYGMNNNIIRDVLDKTIPYMGGMEDLQFITCTNKRADFINQYVRTFMNYSTLEYKGYNACVPRPGEKLLSLQKEDQAGILKSEFLTIVDILSAEVKTTMESGKRIDICYNAEAIVITEDGNEVVIDISLSKCPDTLHVKFGYAITTHKSQGSQFPKVIWFDDSTKKMWGNIKKLRYTGATRAQDKLLLVLSA